jgi:general L-amino acid transport system permease protein
VGTVVWLWRTRVFKETGHAHHRLLWALGVFAVISVGGYALLGGPYDLSRPRVNDARLGVDGGFSMLGSYFALTVALVIYTASHVAEIVRGSIQAVPKGQTEASEALALSSFQRLRFVVLPQAARIAIPPTINQYLNLTKNTSLAAAIAFPEITRVTTTYIGNANPAPQAILILMAVYLGFSLTISIVVNIANRRSQLVTN